MTPPGFRVGRTEDDTATTPLASWRALAGHLATPAQPGAVALLRRVDPPIGPTPGPRDWTPLESLLGRLPTDYKELIEDRGPGPVADVVVRGPGAPYPSLDAQRWLAALNRTVAHLRTRTCAHRPPPIHPEPGGILPWGEVDDGHLVAWAVLSEDPDSWPVVVLSRDWDELTLYPMTATGYLLARLPGPDLQLAPTPG